MKTEINKRTKQATRKFISFPRNGEDILRTSASWKPKKVWYKGGIS